MAVAEQFKTMTSQETRCADGSRKKSYSKQDPLEIVGCFGLTYQMLTDCLGVVLSSRTTANSS